MATVRESSGHIADRSLAAPKNGEINHSPGQPKIGAGPFARPPSHEPPPRPAPRRHARPDIARAGGADLLPIPRPLHLPIWSDRGRTFERVAANLLPSGRFAWNAFACDHDIAARLDCQRQHKPCPKPSTTPPATTALTSPSRTAPAARSGGPPETNGSASSTSLDLKSKRSTAALHASCSPRRVGSTSSSPVIGASDSAVARCRR